MVVYANNNNKYVVVKCNPKNAKCRMLSSLKGGKTATGSLWIIPYALLEPFIDPHLSTEMMMRSFEQPENQGIKTYFDHSKKADEPVDKFPETSPQWHIMNAICELWRRLEDDNLEKESKTLGRHVLSLRAAYSSMINELFSVIGREVSKKAANEWEAGKITSHLVS